MNRHLLSSCAVVFATACTLLGGCTTVIAGWHQIRSVAADDMGPETAAKIAGLSRQLDDAVAADDLDAAITLSKSLWDISSGSCNACQSAAWPALHRFSEAVLATPTTKPAYQAAAILKRASTEGFADRSYDGPSAGLEAFRSEVKDAFGRVEARAKPELLEKAAALESAGRPASAAVVLAQLAALFPDDAETQSRRATLVNAMRQTHTFTVKTSGGPAADALARSTFAVEAIAFDATGAVTAMVIVGEPTTDVESAAEAQSASVVRGKKTVPNRDYERLQAKIAHTEKLRADDQRDLGKGQSTASNQSDIERRTREIADLQKQLSRESPTEEVDNVVTESFPATRHTRIVRRTLGVKVTRGSEVLAEATSVASASRSGLVHGGYPDAGIAPKNEPTPALGSVDEGTIADAASRARTVVLQAYRGHLAAIAKGLLDKGGADAVEGAALLVVLDPTGEHGSEAEAVKKGLQVGDPRTLLATR